MTYKARIDANALCSEYLEAIHTLMHSILTDETIAIDSAATAIADQIAADKLVHIFGPGGHSNLAAQEIFFRAGGLMHISAILDEGTLLSNGALRSMAIERTPQYGRVVISDQGLGKEDLLILVNAYGINAALIDVALEARERGVTVIGVSSKQHAANTKVDHPARHPSKKNLHDVVDFHIDTKVPIGDAVVSVRGVGEKISAISTFASAYALNCLMIHSIAKLVDKGIEPPVWRSGNAPGGDEANAKFVSKFRQRVRAL